MDHLSIVKLYCSNTTRTVIDLLGEREVSLGWWLENFQRDNLSNPVMSAEPGRVSRSSGVP